MPLKTLLRNLLHRRAADRDLDAEIGAYADEMNARRAHSVYAEPLREQVRAARPGAGIESCARDLRYALRMLRKTPWLTLACVLTFAVGVAANTVVFSMANALIWRQLPVAHPEQLQMLSLAVHGHNAAPALTRDDLQTLAADGRRAFSAVTTASITTAGVSVAGKSRVAWVGYVSGNFFSMLGVHPARGSFFTRDDAQAVVLSDDYWHSRFGANPAVIGQSVILDGKPVAIAGIAPRGFHGISNLISTQMFVPAGLFSSTAAAGIGAIGIPIVRLRPGAAAPEARAALGVFAGQMARVHSKTDRGLVVQMWPMGTGMVSNQGGANPFGTVAALFLTLSGLVLLLAAANIMGVLLARSAVRQREMDVRSALGASGARLARQVLIETLVLAAAGGAVGMLLGMSGSNSLSGLPPQTSIPLMLRFSFDGRVFAYGCFMALIMAFVAGLAPAWRAARSNPSHSLRGPESGAGARRRQRLRSVLVAGQTASSLMLLIVGGLFVRCMLVAEHRPLGFQPAHVWNFVLDTSGAGYSQAQGEQFYAQLLPAVRALPGIQSASLAQFYPMGFVGDYGDAKLPGTNRVIKGALVNAVSPDYFRTLGIALLQGRGFTAGDTATAPGVVVITPALSAKLWSGENPIGRQIIVGPAKLPVTVIGVAAAASYRLSGGSGDPQQIYLALGQNFNTRQVLQVRTAASVTTPVPAVEGLLERLAPNVPLGEVQSMNSAIHGLNGLFLFSLGARLATAMGLLGLFLALIGVYGVVAYAAAQRTHEIGIRIALGARPRQVVAAILRSAGAIIVAGIVVGLLLAAAFGKLAGAFLVGVSGLDPLTFIAATALLALVAFAASLLPALRASRADPLAALRCE